MRLKTIRTTGTLIAGGVATGLLLAMTVPTTMKSEAGETWPHMAHKPTSAYDPAIRYEAAGEDLTPVYWQPAWAEYPAPDADTLADSGADSEDYAPSYELLPAELMEDRNRGVTVEFVHTDAAAASADAAQEAAADVQAVESTAVQAPVTPGLIAEPQAVTATS